jgi:hypothetical protein
MYKKIEITKQEKNVCDDYHLIIYTESSISSIELINPNISINEVEQILNLVSSQEIDNAKLEKQKTLRTFKADFNFETLKTKIIQEIF